MSPRSSRAAARAAARARRARAEDAAAVADESVEVRGRPRAGARRTLLDTIKQIPAYLRLLAGLLTDRRVSGVDKLLVAGAIAYILIPIDIIPDFLPFLGQVDDVYLLMLALQRLIANAGRNVVMDHWSGSVDELSTSALRNVLLSAAFFLPARIRRRLRVIGRG